jgi:hypothetical protein
MMISDLPVELQNKIFFYAAEHPCAKIIKQQCDYIFNKSIFAKRCIDDYGCLYHVFYWYDYKMLYENTEQYQMDASFRRTRRNNKYTTQIMV